MGKKSREKRDRRRNLGGGDDWRLPVDQELFDQAVVEVTSEVTRPFFVTPKDQRPTIRASSEVLEIDPGNPMFRLHRAVHGFCHRRDVKSMYPPIAARIQALWSVIEALRDRESFRPFTRVDEEGQVSSISRRAVAVAARFPFLENTIAFDPEGFLGQLVAPADLSKM